MQPLLRLIRTVLKDTRRITPIWIIVFSCISIAVHAIELSMPYIYQKLVHIIETQGSIDSFHFWAGITLLRSIILVIVDRIRGLTGDYLRAKIYKEKMNEVYTRFMSMHIQHVVAEGTGKLLTRLNNGTRAQADIFLSILKIIYNSVARLLILTILFIIWEPILSIFLAGALILTTIVQIRFSKKMRPLTKQETELYEEQGRQTTHMVMKHSLINFTRKQQDESDKLVSINSPLPRLNLKLSYYQYTPMDIIFFILKMMDRGIYVFLGYQVWQGEASFAYMIMLIGYIRLLWGPMEAGLSESSRIYRNLNNYKKMQQYLDTQPPFEDGQAPYIYKNGTIRIQNIRFQYPEKDVLYDNLSCTIPGGKTTALVGNSGSGKSTLIKLLMRVYDVQEGNIYFDDQKLQNISLQSLYPHIGYITQEPTIIDGTVYENICYGSGNIKEEDVRIAIQQAHAPFIYDLNKGRETQLGEKGVKLSGGERQRIAIARIMLRNPEIVILDEPTSALDSLSEMKVSAALENLFANKTVIIIAHRLQTVRHADQILVLEKGNIVEKGTHDDLLEHGKIYKNLIDIQNGTIV